MPLSSDHRANHRAFILVLDSFGLGSAPDAADFGDVGADTFGHIVRACAEGRADKEGVRSGPLYIPNMLALGLGEAHYAATGKRVAGLPIAQAPSGVYGAAAELSKGKDTPSGHWEMAGVPVLFDWGMFPKAEPCFPAELTEALIKEAGLPGILGDKHSSGTVILDELGEEHIKSGKPIVYTSADSVYQIAAHEEHFGLERLYEVCKIARKLVDPYNVGRVIARPFTGEKPGEFKRTGNRKDLAVPPPAPTVLQKVSEAEGGTVISIGKIGDIFAHIGTGQVIKATGNAQIMEKTLEVFKSAPGGSLVMSNFVDFDMEYGHRRDVVGYAAALEYFDRRLPEIMAEMRAGDLVILTADHGCDPTWEGTDHTREYVPVVAFGPGIAARNLGTLKTFADIGQTVAAHLGVEAFDVGQDFLVEEQHERLRKSA